jgi:hypothetical protein
MGQTVVAIVTRSSPLGSSLLEGSASSFFLARSGIQVAFHASKYF